MSNALSNLALPPNEAVKSYAPGTPERAALKAELARLKGEQLEVPIVIGSKRIKTGKLETISCPHDHRHVLGHYHCAGPKETVQAIATAKSAWHEWSRMPWEERVSIFLRAAELLAGRKRALLCAATLLGQSKNVIQTELDAACELIDFWRFNCHFTAKLYAEQPPHGQPGGMWNRLEHRPLEGFVFAVSPFNFTAIGGNLPTAPAMMGNTVLWKPAEAQTFSAWYTFEILEEAGLPPGVINFLPGDGPTIGPSALAHPDLAGLHFTGSTRAFQGMWQTIGGNIAGYKTYPRIVGETGGKDFVVAHKSADVPALAVALLRGAFEFQGQKCSAASRAYIPKSLWSRLRKALYGMLDELRMGDVCDFSNMLNAVINEAAYTKISGYIAKAKRDAASSVEYGGKCDRSVGWFIQPTVILTTDPQYRTMCEEIFGPVLTIYVYPDSQYEQILNICNSTSPYALTGAVFANDRGAIVTAHEHLRNAAGNFYINDKPTGAVVGQQPFGGARASGTNDKAGALQNIMRWTSTRTIKETLDPPRDYRYPFMAEE